MKILNSTRAFQFNNKENVINLKKIEYEGLDLEYFSFLQKSEADELFSNLEENVVYYSDDYSKVRIFGKWHSIPRQQSAFGDTGVSYTFSGNTVAAFPWNDAILHIRDKLTALTGIEFNFALVNRYRNGEDHIGEHRDNEKDLDAKAPIASLSLGAERVFKLRHKDCRRKDINCDIRPVKIVLEHGSLLLMNPPTNEIWYHSLPPKRSIQSPRINITFRKMVT